MADIDFTHPHSMSRDDARAATARVAQDLERQLDATSRWEGDTLHFERSSPRADGRIDVADDAVHVAINLSLMLKPMKGRIRREAKQLLNKHLQQENGGA